MRITLLFYFFNIFFHHPNCQKHLKKFFLHSFFFSKDQDEAKALRLMTEYFCVFKDTNQMGLLIAFFKVDQYKNKGTSFTSKDGVLKWTIGSWQLDKVHSHLIIHFWTTCFYILLLTKQNFFTQKLNLIFLQLVEKGVFQLLLHSCQQIENVKEELSSKKNILPKDLVQDLTTAERKTLDVLLNGFMSLIDNKWNKPIFFAIW